MKSLIILILFIFITSLSSVFCQKTESKFIVFKSDSENNLGYYRISAKDHSSWGFINTKGEIVIPLEKYKYLNSIDNQGMILATKDNKGGYIDINENILIPFIYDEIGVFSSFNELAPVIKDGKQGFINRKGEVIIPLQYETNSHVTYYYDPGLAILQKCGKYGVIDINNNIVIPFTYNNIERSRLYDFFIATKDKELFLISLRGTIISTYNNAEIISNFSANFNNPNKKNLPILLKQRGDQILSDNISRDIDYYNGSKRVKDSIMLKANNKFAYIDKKGDFIIPFGKYDIAKPFALGRKAIVAKKGRYGIIDEFGKEVLPLEYDFVEQPSENAKNSKIFVVSKGKEVMMLDSNANVIPIEGIVSYIDRYGYLMVSNKNNRKGIVDYSGKEVIPFEYDTLIYGRQSQFIAKKENLYGYITDDNKIIQPFDYRYIYTLNNEIAFVNKLGKVGLYDDTGEVIIPFEYDAIYDTWYNNKFDKYIVVKDGKVGTIDANNKVVIPIIYDALSGWVEYGPEAHFARKNGKYGLISHQGEIIIPIEYEYVGNPIKGLIEVRKNRKFGVITSLNKEILPCIYDKLILDIPFYLFEKQTPQIVIYKDHKWSSFDTEGVLQKENIPEDEIIRKYGEGILYNNELSNEHHDFHMKQYPIVKFLNDNNEIK